MTVTKNLNLTELLKHPLWRRERTFSEFEAWLDLVQLASHDPNTHKLCFNNSGKILLFNIERGDLQIHLTKLAARWDWHRNKVTAFLDVLANNGQIKCAAYTNKIKVITICNFHNICPLKAENTNFPGEVTAYGEANNGQIMGEYAKFMLKPDFHTLYRKIYNKEYNKKDSQNSESIPLDPDFIKFNIWLRENAPHCADPVFFPRQFSEKEFVSLKEKYSGYEISQVILQIDNRTDLLGKYNNLPLTVRKWLEKEYTNQ